MLRGVVEGRGSGCPMIQLHRYYVTLTRQRLRRCTVQKIMVYRMSEVVKCLFFLLKSLSHPFFFSICLGLGWPIRGAEGSPPISQIGKIAKKMVAVRNKGRQIKPLLILISCAATNTVLTQPITFL